ncbi:hypothetical protein [Halomonas korlensis]|uniref:Uncharacterized protein n=1 Tax=Halomonas korlensis TaxID=463301 RepID=A0A1I7IJX9_9GAMM|nr:hypothetical protein [Halomonas korlensis]SFU73188.1 hypothetical protein SAMN04487955_10781 [Halomonas korlensis]
MTRRHFIPIAALLGTAAATALAWWGWQVADASLLLLGSRLC